MKNMVYTTYLSKMKDVPEDAMRVIIMRSSPMSAQGLENTIVKQELSPNFEILMEYKRTSDWDTFKASFEEQIEKDERVIPMLNRIVEALEHNPVALICCEKDQQHCHRSILAEKLKFLGARVIEIGKGEY